MNQYESIREALFHVPLDKFIKERFPQISYKEEISPSGTLYLITNCFIHPVQNSVETFYINKDENFYRCFDCGRSGGIIDICKRDFQMPDGEILNLTGKIFNIKEEDLLFILNRIWDDEDLADNSFNDARLSDLRPYTDGSWRKSSREEFGSLKEALSDQGIIVVPPVHQNKV